MSITTPSTSEVSDNIVAQLQSSLNQTIPLLPKAFNRVLAKAIAGVFVLLYKYGGFMHLQMFVATATLDETTINGLPIQPLLFWGRLVDVTDPVPATRAEFTITITVNNQTGSLESGSQLLGENNGVTYLTIGSVLLDAATVTATVRASGSQDGDGSGSVGNLEVADVLNFANALANVDRATVIATVVNTGADAETEDAYRTRVTDRFQQRPQGGAYADYHEWATSAPGIINAYPYTGDPGEVLIYSEATVASSGSADGIPTGAQLTVVLETINLDEAGIATRRNANAFPVSNAISRTEFTVTVTGVTGVASLAATEASITDDVQAFFLRAEPYIVGLSVPPRLDTITRTRILGLVEDVVTADGGTFTDVTFEVTSGGGAIASHLLGQGEKAKAVLAFI